MSRKLFDQIQIRKPKKNKFDLSHEKKFTAPMGVLIPSFIQEIVPGDTFRVKTENFIRLNPMLAPVMHQINVYMHYFFVPNRIIWSEWEDFITGGPEGTTAPVHPYYKLNTASASAFKWEKGGLSDYMGIPPVESGETVTDEQFISALPFRAYHKICNDYYADQTLETEMQPGGLWEVPVTSGEQTGDALGMLDMRTRCWEKDYFTSALPWAQRGPEMSMPIDITGDAPIYGKPLTPGQNILITGLENGNNTSYGIGEDDTLPTTPGALWARIEGLGTSTTINELRRAVRIQEWLEKNARGGARYIEQILHHFGIVSSDARLQRPEYLGGGKQPVVISEVVSTFQMEAEGLPQGNMSGHGISVGTTNGFTRSFEEHGYVIGMMSVMPRTAYQQGIPKHLQRFDKLEYYWPEFANLGEQEIKQKELFYNPASAVGTGDATFGYQSRYAEYKYGISTVHGDMRDTMDYWHMGRKFATYAPPALNNNFVLCNPTTRIFAVTDSDYHLNVQTFHRVDALRPMPYFGTPQL